MSSTASPGKTKAKETKTPEKKQAKTPEKKEVKK